MRPGGSLGVTGDWPKVAPGATWIVRCPKCDTSLGYVPTVALKLAQLLRWPLELAGRARAALAALRGRP